MEWRCEWCGKPHEVDDPPCDNCGHGTFEKAVVQRAGEGENPATSTVWVCTECGRQHVKNSPPCSRCGNATLEQQELSPDDFDDEISAPGYRDLLTTRYAIGLVAALALATVFVAGVTGVVDIPGLTDPGLQVDGVPGSADTAGGLDLNEVESEFVAALNASRREANLQPFSRHDGLDDVAEYYNQHRVKRLLTEENLPPLERAGERLQSICDGTPVPFDASPSRLPSASEFDAAGAAGDGLATVFGQVGSSEEYGDTDYRIGVDVHGVGDDIYVTLWIC